jgi:hypothetical protein
MGSAGISSNAAIQLYLSIKVLAPAQTIGRVMRQRTSADWPVRYAAILFRR